jgi:hypothetical protein
MKEFPASQNTHMPIERIVAFKQRVERTIPLFRFLLRRFCPELKIPVPWLVG